MKGALNMAKYLELKKINWNTSCGRYTWFLAIKKEYAMDTYGKRIKKLAEKLEGILNGDFTEANHGGDTYTLSETKFRANGKKVYLVHKNYENAPCLIYTKGFGAEKARRNYNAQVNTTIIVDEDIKFFEQYGYTER